MNKDQVKDVFKDIAGKVQEDAGKAEKIYGDVKQVIKDANKPC